ncbi:aspartate aminotransferase [candidate division WOR-3 bacterium JGI_Cruoil_03_44_89]|uniref:Aminotransferase n=1 Tax=candidate division WOR-3 bacterium JGI_Cruoil_03_44_89 TaxID=1973748 RepID=A0A235BVP3_UNCW3|nr:MAG: aspartate aminotransferase [candidate division WOR-3 bacterium JGI_Cruoil_03_44_89]
MISKRAMVMPSSPIRKLFPYSDRAKERGIKVYHLNIGQPDVPTPKELLNGIKGFSKPVLPYGQSEGIKELRMAIADYFKRYELEVSPEEVIITQGGSEAILFSMLLLCNPGDEILVFEPFYANYNGLAVVAGIKLVPVTTDPKEDYHLPKGEKISEKIGDRTRAILVCSPNNPTGTVYTREEMEMLADIARKHDLSIISDEVYREFVFDGMKHTSAFAVAPERTLLVDSISKRMSACGARIGFVTCKDKKMLPLLVKLAQSRLCPATIEQYGAIEGFKYIDNYIDGMRREYEHRRNVARGELLKLPNVSVNNPEGAFYAMITLPVDDSEKFVIYMLEDFNVDKKTIMLAPGAGFYATEGLGRNEARIAFVLKEEDIKDAIYILGRGIKAYNS